MSRLEMAPALWRWPLMRYLIGNGGLSGMVAYRECWAGTDLIGWLRPRAIIERIEVSAPDEP